MARSPTAPFKVLTNTGWVSSEDPESPAVPQRANLRIVRTGEFVTVGTISDRRTPPPIPRRSDPLAIVAGVSPNLRPPPKVEIADEEATVRIELKDLPPPSQRSQRQQIKTRRPAMGMALGILGVGIATIGGGMLLWKIQQPSAQPTPMVAQQTVSIVGVSSVVPQPSAQRIVAAPIVVEESSAAQTHRARKLAVRSDRVVATNVRAGIADDSSEPEDSLPELENHTQRARTIRVRTIEAAEVMALQRVYQPQIQRCYERAIQKNSRLSDVSVDITLSVAASGMVQRVAIAGSEDEDLLTCLSLTLKRWVFQPVGASVDVVMPLQFRAQRD